MKKSFLSPVASLLISLSLALGILVCNMSGYGLLTTAHACGGSTVIGNTLAINNALAPNGVAFRNILVNGQLVEAGVIAGPVQFVSSSVVNANGVIVGNEVPGAQPSGSDDYGVLVGNEAPCTDGVLVGNEVTNGGGTSVSGNPATLGVLVGNEINVNGLIISSSGTATGGIVTGDNLTVSGGVITGQNLLISGATINGGFINMSGSITGVSTPSGN